MVGNTDRVSRGTLDHITGKTAMFTLTTPSYVGLVTAMGIDAGTGFTEVPTGTSYGRKSMAATDWNAASASAPSTVTNANACTFTISTGAWASGANIIGFILADASSGVNILNYDYLGPGLWMPFTCTSASPGVITCPAHGFSNGDLVAVSVEAGGSLPTGLTASSGSTLYTVATAATDTFTVSTNTTSTGSGWVRKVVPLVVGSANITPSIAAGSLILTNG